MNGAGTSFNVVEAAEMFTRTSMTEWTRAVGTAAVLMACDGPDRVATPDELPMHARIDDADHHGRGSVCLPLGEFGACGLEMTFYPERMGLVTADSATSVFIDGDVRILSGTGPDDLVFRPGEAPNAHVTTTASGEMELIVVSDFEIELNGSTGLVDGSIMSMLAEVFEVRGDIDVACLAGEDAQLITETGDVRGIRCDREW